MDLEEARETVESCKKLPAEKYKEAVEMCIEDDKAADAVKELEVADKAAESLPEGAEVADEVVNETESTE